jgi:predicted phage baseplate assembly protein
MALPTPNLDDRRFQDLVDDAKRLVQQRCPEWTDHNVSDPGVTLIETFAFMVDQLLYRLNRVPDRNYVKFLELIGVRLFPPTAAGADVTFWLSSPQPTTIEVPGGARVSTIRTESDPSASFTTNDRLAIIPCHLISVLSHPVGSDPYLVYDDLERGAGINAFGARPEAGDELLIGLSAAVPRCVVNLRFDCRIEGVGVDPTEPPWRWEAWDGLGWTQCEISDDETGGFNRAGDLRIHLPASHAAHAIDNHAAGWIRCRLLEPYEGQPFYGASPRIMSLSAATIGGTIHATHAERVVNEMIGLSENVPGQRFLLENRPVVPTADDVVLEVAAGHGWEEWRRVENFADSGPDDHHFAIDGVAGEVQLGPAVREPDGSFRQYGAVPPKGVPLRIREYHTGGGERGNVTTGMIRVLDTSIPFVSSVENRHPAHGGVDAETVEEAKIRGPILLRTRNRAVTAEDYEELAREAAPEAARVRCVPVVDSSGSEAVRVLVVPATAEEPGGRLRFESLLPAEETLGRIAVYLDDRRVVGARVSVEPPAYQGVTVIARVRARPHVDSRRLQEDALNALYAYLHPIHGGPEGTGWPFGRDIHLGEMYAVLQHLPGTEFVDDARLYGADPITGERGESIQRLVIEPDSLVFSYGHQVLVEGA